MHCAAQHLLTHHKLFKILAGVHQKVHWKPTTGNFCSEKEKTQEVRLLLHHYCQYVAKLEDCFVLAREPQTGIIGFPLTK